MDTVPCMTCGATVASVLADTHQQWHKDISDVAIQSTERIDALTEIVRVRTRSDHGR